MNPTRLFATLTICGCQALGASEGPYDPLATGPAPKTHDLSLEGPHQRDLPLRVFLPSEISGPVILFSHGLGGSREGSNYLGRHWSARGYVTIFLQHTGSDRSILRDKSGPEAVQTLRQAANLQQYRNRIDDILMVLELLENAPGSIHPAFDGHVDATMIGVAGHSFGAKTTQAFGGEQGGGPRRPVTVKHDAVRAVLPMSPSPAKGREPNFSFGKASLPWLIMTGTEDGVPFGLTDTKPSDRLQVFPALPSGDKYELVFEGGEHHAFTEGSFFMGRPRQEHHHPAVLAISTAFWDAYLRDSEDALVWLRRNDLPVLSAEDDWRWK
ncbi:MAG: alpha/beta hydrolase family protein [Verrucomicrobiales bacterium]